MRRGRLHEATRSRRPTWKCDRSRTTRKCWPSDQGQTLLSNTTKIFFGTNDIQTAEFVSKSLGNATIIVDSGGRNAGTSRQHGTSSGSSYSESSSRTSSEGTSSSWQQQKRELLAPDEIINLPPRHLKSLLVSVAFPALCLGDDPSAQILCVSYAQDLADKLSRDCRQILASDWYRQLFPATRLSSQRAAMPEFDTTAQGCRLATSVGGVLTGRGADLIVIDGPAEA